MYYIFLFRHAMLPDRSLVPASCIRSTDKDEDNDSDLSLDD